MAASAWNYMTPVTPAAKAPITNGTQVTGTPGAAAAPAAAAAGYIPQGSSAVTQSIAGTPQFTYNGSVYPDTQSGLSQADAAATAAGMTNGQIPLLSSTPGYAAAEGNALRTGPSPWANIAQQQQDMAATNALDAGVNQTAGATAAEDASLASTGGLSSGARERVQEGGEKNLMSMAQGVDQNLATNKLAISGQDAQNQINQLAQFNQLNQANTANQDAAVASAQTAQAIQNAPTSSCFITTAMVDFYGMPDDCHEMQKMREFRDQYVAKNPKIKHQVARYYKLAKAWDKDVRAIKDAAFWREIRKRINLAVFMVAGKHGYHSDFNENPKSDRSWQAYLVYRDMVYFVRREVYKRRVRAAIVRPWTVIKSYFKKVQTA